ncbi:probable disease resistance protein At4g27220 isoform X2 [Magnolia sinica]|nr:probable disease resistance protein At4g27220 isoform X2 [Magnolia sinica]
MDVIGPIIEIAKNLWVPLSQQWSYAKSISENVETLRRKMEELSHQEKDVKTVLIKGELQSGKTPKNEVRLWQENVQRVENEARDIEKKSRENLSCLRGCFPNYPSRITLSKLAVEKIKIVVELQEKGRLFGDLFVDSPLDSGKTLPTTALVGKTTPKKTREAIWECLMEDQVRIIGVYGMGGVGKTTIMKHIYNQLIEDSAFDSVIWVTVSKDSNLEQLQKGVAKSLDLEFSDNADEMRRSRELFAALKRRKRFILILDDMWVAFPLEGVGIPKPDIENGCKLVLTTRSLEICQGMETQRAIRVELLSEEEAWELFKDKVGGGVDFSPQVEKIAKLVAKECCQLPLAIITVGRSMREVNDIRLWRNTLNDLQSSAMEIKSMEENVFASLKFSYTRLRNDTIRACFLYCALYPEDFAIPSKELIEYWMGEGFIDDVGNREAQMDKGHAILNEITYACMLEGVFEGIYGECVKMHDLVRDMAIDITRASPRFLVKASAGLTEMPKVDGWMEDVQRISLMRNNIEILSGRPNCPRLSTLLLQENRHLKYISHSFFEHMNSLRVLDLSYTKIEELPQSVSNLGNLHTLLLHYCVRLKKLPSLANLKTLRVLDLYYAPIEELPQGMEGLVKLKRLELSWTYNLYMFPAGIVSRLSLLEDLMMYGNPWRWSSNSTEIGGNIDEIKSLNQLANLSIHIADVPSFLDYARSMKWQTLKSFHLMVGLPSESISLPSDCTIEFHGCDLICYENSLMVPNSTRVLGISECNITRLSELSSLLNVTEFKECYIHKCEGMECILMDDENTFPSLETLDLKLLPSLSSLYKGVMPYGTLGSLKNLYIGFCNNLKNLLSLELLQHLQNLEQVKIRYCDLMEEVVEEEGEILEDMTDASSTIILPRLKSLSVSGLQELKSICGRTIICDSLCTIRVRRCPKLKKLPLSINNIPLTLKEIKGEKEWWDALEWDKANVKTFFQHLFIEIGQ